MQRIYEPEALIRANRESPKTRTTPRNEASEMGFDHEADRRCSRQGRKVRRRLWNKLRKLIRRRQAVARRLKQIDAVLRNHDKPEGSRGAGC